MKRVLIIAIVVMLALMQIAAADADYCDDDQLVEALKFEENKPSGLNFSDVSVGDTFMLPITDSTGYIEINITEVKDGKEAMTFNWTSDQAVCKYLVKSGQSSTGWIDTLGATSGSGEVFNYDAYVAGENNVAAISHISFCFGCDGGITEVPEFPAIALPIAAIIGLAFFFQRRKE